ncbi:hypothetical protein AVEN_33360-1 [Araneus ventricosus]|uniref:Uncharacterized protein n=1 Tax=Araneus ventricosus TaxID=182803 RepID=A0A4Y2J8V1_ARAVE|nr:hypothetical protein AVEN_33360-1 [Araneus ventricosus]
MSSAGLASKFGGRNVLAQLASSLSDHSSKFRGTLRDNSRVALKRYLDVTKLNEKLSLNLLWIMENFPADVAGNFTYSKCGAKQNERNQR